MPAFLAPLLAPAFQLWGSPVTWAEVAGSLLAVWMVVCNMRVDPLGWPLAIASSLLYALLFADSRLYGEASLQLVFVALAFWGWWQWLRGRQADGSALRPRRLGSRDRWLAVGATVVAWGAIGMLLHRATDSDVAWADAFPTAGSLVGQWLLGRQYVENWPAWVIVNVASVGLFAWKGLWLTVLLYALFAAMAFMGWRRWQALARVPA